jgi:hypothetical protein
VWGKKVKERKGKLGRTQKTVERQKGAHPEQEKEKRNSTSVESVIHEFWIERLVSEWRRMHVGPRGLWLASVAIIVAR